MTIYAILFSFTYRKKSLVTVTVAVLKVFSNVDLVNALWK